MVLLALPPADHLLIERDRGQFVPSRRRRMMANARAECLLKIPAEPSPELRIPGAAAQTRVVSMAGIRLGSWESARAFKGIICDDISEFESSHPSQAVPSLWAMSRWQKFARHSRELWRRWRVSEAIFLHFGRRPANFGRQRSLAGPREISVTPPCDAADRDRWLPHLRATHSGRA